MAPNNFQYPESLIYTWGVVVGDVTRSAYENYDRDAGASRGVRYDRRNEVRGSAVIKNHNGSAANVFVFLFCGFDLSSGLFTSMRRALDSRARS